MSENPPPLMSAAMETVMKAWELVADYVLQQPPLSYSLLKEIVDCLPPSEEPSSSSSSSPPLVTPRLMKGLLLRSISSDLRSSPTPPITYRTLQTLERIHEIDHLLNPRRPPSHTMKDAYTAVCYHLNYASLLLPDRLLRICNQHWCSRLFNHGRSPAASSLLSPRLEEDRCTVQSAVTNHRLREDLVFARKDTAREAAHALRLYVQEALAAAADTAPTLPAQGAPETIVLDGSNDAEDHDISMPYTIPPEDPLGAERVESDGIAQVPNTIIPEDLHGAQHVESDNITQVPSPEPTQVAAVDTQPSPAPLQDSTRTEPEEDATGIDEPMNVQRFDVEASVMEPQQLPHSTMLEVEEQIGDTSGSSRRTRNRLSSTPVYDHFFRQRKRHRWTREEEETLRKAVDIYHAGNWSEIKEAYPQIFANRTAGHIKDKWRNMTKN